MATDQESAVQHGMNLVAELQDIMPQQADARLTRIYKEIQETLRVPIVNKIFRTLANYPDYLEEAWGQAAPLAQSVHFEKARDDLCAQAVLNEAPERPVMELSDFENPDELQAFNDTIHYVLPKLLLIVTFFHKAAFGDQVTETVTTPELFQLLPSGIAKGTAKVQMVDPATADLQVHQLFEDIKAHHGHSAVTSYYCGLGQWPEFLQNAWGRVRPHIGGQQYNASRLKLIDTARASVSSWPMTSVKPSAAHHEDIRAILMAFQCKYIPEMLLDVALIKSFMEGRNAALRSRFSLTT